MLSNLNKLFILLISIAMFNFAYAQCDMPDNTLSIDGSDIWYSPYIENNVYNLLYQVDDGYISWISINPSSGSTPPEEHKIVTLTIDATNLTDGIYYANL